MDHNSTSLHCLWLVMIALFPWITLGELEFLKVPHRYYTTRTGVGSIASYNYPFIVDTPTMGMETKYFFHHITFETEDTEQFISVCFTFHKFDLSPFNVVGCPNFEGKLLIVDDDDVGSTHYICADGTEYTDPNKTIWEKEFCVLAKNYKLDLTLIFPRGEYANGFYATYRFGTSDQSIQTEVPCEDWQDLGPTLACFDRSCINSTYQFCDGVVDCEDGTDESYAHAQCWPQASLVPPDIVACDMEQNYAQQTPCGFLEVGPHWKYETLSPGEWGPALDHTHPYNTFKGKYIVTDYMANNGTLNDQILTFEPGALKSGETYCLTFWYNMNGYDPGQLQVFWANKMEGKRPDWSRLGSFYDWQPGQIEYTIPDNPGDQYKVVSFVAKRGGDRQSKIALDDISFLKGECVNLDDVSCNFEYGLCGWTITSGFEVTNKESGIDDLPDTDHSSGTPTGYYLMTKEGSNAILSPYTAPHSKEGIMCFYFYYYLIGEFPSVIIKFGEHQETVVPDSVMDGRWQIVRLGKIERPHSALEYQAHQLEIGVEMTAQTKMFLIDHIVITQHHGDSVDSFEGCKNIDPVSCDSKEYRCKRTGECIPSYMRCDGKCDCCENELMKDDDEDQTYCEGAGNICASEGMFQCGTGLCVAGDAKCDGKVDCLDGSDELEYICIKSVGSTVGHSKIVLLLMSLTVTSLLSLPSQHII